MKKHLAILLPALIFSCEKAEINQNDFVDISYELQTGTTGFSQLGFGEFYELSNGLSGVQLVNWTVPDTGVLIKTVSIRKGFMAVAMGVHPTSDDWELKIRSSNGTVLKSGTPSFIPDSNHYYLRIETPAQ